MVFTYGLRGATDTLALVVCRGLVLVGELLLHGMLQHEARTCETGRKKHKELLKLSKGAPETVYLGPVGEFVYYLLTTIDILLLLLKIRYQKSNVPFTIL